MACIYLYKGHRFNSELELDDFLLENKPFESLFGDLVFSRTPAQNNVSSILSFNAFVYNLMLFDYEGICYYSHRYHYGNPHCRCGDCQYRS